MRAYIYDDVPGDQRLAHDSGRQVSEDDLKALGVLYWRIPIDDEEDGKKKEWEKKIDKVAKERDYKNRDVIDVSRPGLGDAYESKLATFFEEHMHEDEEIRFVLEGSGFFDVRAKNDLDQAGAPSSWIRVAMTPGDLLVLPAGIYHRFTLDTKDRIRAMRLFKEEPKWVPYRRGEETDVNRYRKEYVSSVAGKA